MKNIIVSAGLVAAGATGLHAAYAPGLSRMEASKPWSVSLALRGFYDDNYATLPSGSGTDAESFGIEVSPSVSVNFPMDQTFVGASYKYTAKYYEDREDNNVDQTHEFILKADHRFSQRYEVNLDNSFVYSQEPELTEDIGVAQTTLLRTEADLVRNRAELNFRAQITELVGLEVGYQNGFYSYSDEGVASRSALLDRLEHLIHVDGRWVMRENLIAVAGYQYGIISYTGDESIDSQDAPVDPLNPPGPEGDIRDNQSHYFYVGGDYKMASQLTGSARVGVQYVDYEELDDSDGWSPYVDLKGNYMYLPGSYVQFGVRYLRNPTDIAGTEGDFTADQESGVVYASVNHRITPKLTGSLLGQYQHSRFEGGAADGEVDNVFLLGLSFDYRFNQHWSAEAGYSFDRLDSDLPSRSFSRNRIYIGARATY